MLDSLSHPFAVTDGFAGVRDAAVVIMLVEVWSMDSSADTMIDAFIDAMLGFDADMLFGVEITLVVTVVVNLELGR